MKRCQRCGYPIESNAREIVPEAMSGAKPTVYLHATASGCAAAKQQRRISRT